MLFFPAQNDDNYSKETNLQTSRKNSSQRKTSRFQQNQKLELPGRDSICKPCLNAYFCRVGYLVQLSPQFNYIELWT